MQYDILNINNLYPAHNPKYNKIKLAILNIAQINSILRFLRHPPLNEVPRLRPSESQRVCFTFKQQCWKNYHLVSDDRISQTSRVKEILFQSAVRDLL